MTTLRLGVTPTRRGAPLAERQSLPRRTTRDSYETGRDRRFRSEPAQVIRVVPAFLIAEYLAGILTRPAQRGQRGALAP